MPILDYNKMHMFEYQTPATLNQANPVQNTWYTILDTTSNVRVYTIAVNVEDTNETLECQATVDGETIAGLAISANHSTNYWCHKYSDGINRVDYIYGSTDSTSYRSSFILEGRSVKIQLRKTSATGAGNLTGIVTYGVLKPC